MSSPEEIYLSREDQEAAFRAKAEAAKRRWQDRKAQIFWRNVLADEVGRREIWRILDELDAFRTAFRVAPSGVPDKYATWFWHGRSTYGFELYQQLSVISREGIAAMHDEWDARFAPEQPPSE